MPRNRESEYQMEKGLDDPVTAIGLMSGTSLDGIDAALIVTDGVTVTSAGPGLTLKYEPALRRRIAALLGARERTDEADAVERGLTLAHAAAVERLLSDAGVVATEVAVIGFHGQTVMHAPAESATWQIGDGRLLADRTGVAVVNDFRSADMASGGEGAPFAPVYHRALSGEIEKPLAVLNIGGVGNVTWIGESGRLVAFDTGPGNAMIDDWVAAHTGQTADIDGKLAQSGQIDESALAVLLAHPYFDRPSPKSLDRNDFAINAVEGLTVADGAATLTGFTVAAVARAEALLPEPVRRWLVTGGGRHNPALMAGLADRLSAPVAPVEAVGWDGDALEAQMIGFLAVRSIAGLPLSFPTTTGAARPMPGGVRYAPD